MPLEFIEFKGHKYPSWQASGHASRFIMTLAIEICNPFKKSGIDIGCNREEWAMPQALRIDPVLKPGYDAMNLPGDNWDFIFNSHLLEHVKENWNTVLDYWLSKIVVGGIIFMYLPHSSQEYWKPENNRKHVHSFNGSEIGNYLESLGHKVYVSPGPDHNNSFVVICEKVDKIETSLTIEELRRKLIDAI